MSSSWAGLIPIAVFIALFAGGLWHELRAERRRINQMVEAEAAAGIKALGEYLKSTP